MSFDESALIVYSFDEVCKMLRVNALTAKRLIIYHRIPVEIHDLDFEHVENGILDQWPQTEASHTIMIKKPDFETLKSLLEAHDATLTPVIPVAPPVMQHPGGTISSSEVSRRGRGRDPSYDEAKKICMRLLRDAYKRDKQFRAAAKLRERVVKKLGGGAPSERSISRWMKEWIQEIKKG